jgi:large subunit ribosomal protein L25
MQATLNARPRSTFGKNAARKLRQTGYVPGILYGHGDETRPIELSTNELTRVLSSISVENTLIDLRIEGAQPTRALIREVQYHPYRSQIQHIDFLVVHAGEAIQLQVPVRIHGTPAGVREQGGLLQEVLRELDVSCLPRHIPDAIEVDVEPLGIGEAIHVRDIEIPDVRILNDPDLVICAVSTPTVEALPEGAETADGVSGEIQPELIRDRRKDGEDVPSQQGGASAE